MNEQDKQLLLKDLCARLPYNVLCKTELYSEPFHLLGILDKETILLDSPVYGEGDGEWYISGAKPYLRPLSSMTEEEFVYFMGLRGRNLSHYDIQQMMKESFSHPNSIDIVNTLGRYSFNIDWLNKNMFDYRGLIERKLAIDCTGLHIYD